MLFTINRRRLVAGLSSLGAAASMPIAARAQNPWPNRAITIIVNFPPGGLTDAIARVFGEYVERKTGQQVIIDNKPGAGGNIGAALVARAKGDGYTFLHTVSGTLVQNRVLYDNLGFDPDKDFVPVAATSSGELPVAVHKSLPVNNVKELIAYARQHKINFGSWAPGSGAHIVCAKLNEIYGTNMEIVHYRGEGPMWVDMGSGSLQVAMGSYQALRPLLSKGDIRLIALPARRRNAKFPDLPTMAEEGYTQDAFSLFGWLGLFAPDDTPRPIVERMSALWVEAAASDAGKQMYDTFGLHEQPLNHIEMAADYERLKARMIPLVRALGVKAS